jgi:hypothetical protein
LLIHGVVNVFFGVDADSIRRAQGYFGVADLARLTNGVAVWIAAAEETGRCHHEEPGLRTKEAPHG